MYAMITKATQSVKMSQQDMLPIYAYGASTLLGNEGYKTSTTTGMFVFDDTWRLTQAIALAMAKGVTVSMMLSAPCALSADYHALIPESVLGGTEKCPDMFLCVHWFEVHGIQSH